MALADIDFYVTEHQYGPLIRGLRDGTLDAGIVMGSVRVEDLVIQHLWYDPMWAVVPTTHPLAQTEIVTRKAPKRSEEHTSELQSLMRISYAVFCLTKKKKERRHT